MLVLVFICLLLSLRLRVRFGERQKSMVMIDWSVAVLLCLFPGSCKPFSVPSSGVLLLPCRRIGLAVWGIDTLNVAWSLGRLLDHGSLIEPLPLVEDGVLIAPVQCMIRTRGRDTVRFTKVKWHAEDVDVQHGLVRLEDQVGMLKLILLLTWVVVTSLKYLLMLGVGCSRLVVIGILFCLICIGL